MLAADPLSGTRYRAIELLGAGAMGEVFLAENVALENRVVVKLIRPELSGNAGFIDRMRLEAQTAARVSHPNVVSVLDFATTSTGQPYVVMEYLVGRTLKEEVLNRGPLPVAEVLELAAQLLDGLAAVHDLGVVHRDLKPANIFLCGSSPLRPLLKIIDFGIAKVTTRTANAPEPLALPTAQGSLVGTPRFLSPEQALGYQIGPASDVYSVGVLLFWVLTGRDLFHERKELVEVLKAHVTEPAPAPSTFNPEVPPHLDRIILKALAKKPADRYANAREFAAALAASPPTPARWPKTEAVNAEEIRRALRPRPPRVAPIETDPMPTVALLRSPTAAAMGLEGTATIAITRTASTKSYAPVLVAVAMLIFLAVSFSWWLVQRAGL